MINDPHHDDLLVGLAVLRDQVQTLVTESLETARILTSVQRTIETLVVAIREEQIATDAVVAVLADIAADTGSISPPRRRRDSVQ